MRRAHLWTPPERAQNPDRPAGPPSAGSDQRRHTKQHERIRAALEPLLKEPAFDDHKLLRVVNNLPEVYVVEPLAYRYKRFLHKYETSVAAEGSGLSPSRVTRGDRRRELRELNHETEAPTRELRRALRDADTEVLLNVRHELAVSMIDCGHRVEAHADDDRQATFDADADALVQNLRGFSYLTHELLNRIIDNDEQARDFFASLEEYEWDLAHIEKERYGTTIIKPTKPFSAQDVLGYVGCTEDELAVYTWSGVITPIIKPSEDLHAMVFTGHTVMDLKDEYISTGSGGAA